MKGRKTCFFCLAPLLFLPCGSRGEEEVMVPEEKPGILQRIGGRLSQAWHSPVYDAYLPLYAWHNRFMYDHDHVHGYNENPWGLGFGRSFVDEDGDWHVLYAMGFMDSFNKFEPIVGYGFLKNWRPFGSDGLRLGGGYTLGITARENYNYIPLPLPLPMAGVGYGRFDIQAVYIPSDYNAGNVLFAWFRWSFGE